MCQDRFRILQLGRSLWILGPSLFGYSHGVYTAEGKLVTTTAQLINQPVS